MFEQEVRNVLPKFWQKYKKNMGYNFTKSKLLQASKTATHGKQTWVIVLQLDWPSEMDTLKIDFPWDQES